MRRARIAFGTGCFVALLAACVGGPGPLPDQGTDQAGQGGGVVGDTSAGEGSSGSSKGSTDPEVVTPPGAPTQISVATFDTTCSEDSDCVAVFQGAVCDACRCPNAAINGRDLEKYSKDLEKAGQDCARPTIPCRCDSQLAGCDAKTKRCVLGVKSADGG